MSQRESVVVRGCLQVLDMAGIPHFRNNSGAKKVHHKTGAAFIRFGAVGWSDIIGILPDGKFLAVECKAPKCPITNKKAGTLSPEQREVRATVERLGGVYVLAYSGHELHTALVDRGYWRGSGMNKETDRG